MNHTSSSSNTTNIINQRRTSRTDAWFQIKNLRLGSLLRLLARVAAAASVMLLTSQLLIVTGKSGVEIQVNKTFDVKAAAQFFIFNNALHNSVKAFPTLTTVVAAHISSTKSSSTTDDFYITPEPSSSGDFSRFAHATPTHQSLSCNACHSRRDNRLVPKLSEHRDCTSCHLPQFVSPNVALCSICHTNLELANPPVKRFPGIRSFNVAFDHRQHTGGAAGRPVENCAACHQPQRKGLAQTIPSSFDGATGGHTACYSCHTAGSNFNGRDMGSCNVCHKAASFYRRTPTATTRAYQVSFSHADHRQGLSCNECHSVSTRAGLPQSRQVSATVAQMHITSTRAQNCMSCHNGARAFGDQNFADCKRCHTGKTFAMK